MWAGEEKAKLLSRSEYVIQLNELVIATTPRGERVFPSHLPTVLEDMRFESLYKLRMIVRELLRDKLSFPFAKPVDPQHVPGYYDVIKDPIDLGTIERRLNKTPPAYDDPEEVVTDIRRVFSNCYQFNQEGTDVWRMAKQIEQLFEEKYREADLRHSKPIMEWMLNITPLFKIIPEQESLVTNLRESLKQQFFKFKKDWRSLTSTMYTHLNLYELAHEHEKVLKLCYEAYRSNTNKFHPQFVDEDGMVSPSKRKAEAKIDLPAEVTKDADDPTLDEFAKFPDVMDFFYIVISLEPVNDNFYQETAMIECMGYNEEVEIISILRQHKNWLKSDSIEAEAKSEWDLPDETKLNLSSVSSAPIRQTRKKQDIKSYYNKKILEIESRIKKRQHELLRFHDEKQEEIKMLKRERNARLQAIRNSKSGEGEN